MGHCNRAEACRDDEACIERRSVVVPTLRCNVSQDDKADASESGWDAGRPSRDFQHGVDNGNQPVVEHWFFKARIAIEIWCEPVRPLDHFASALGVERLVGVG